MAPFWSGFCSAALPRRARRCAFRAAAFCSPLSRTGFFDMQRPVIHIIGAGLAGLAAAVKLGGAPCDIVVHEASRQAGGRCRSFFEEAMNTTIDNGNHLLLSGDDAALASL